MIYVCEKIPPEKEEMVFIYAQAAGYKLNGAFRHSGLRKQFPYIVMRSLDDGLSRCSDFWASQVQATELSYLEMLKLLKNKIHENASKGGESFQNSDEQ